MIVRALLFLTGLIVFSLLLYGVQTWPKAPFVYHYQWPGEWGDQKVWICTGKGNNDVCPASKISSEL